MPNHDIIVIGTSAGGVEALKVLVKDLPSDFEAAIFVVIHVPPTSPGLIPSILDSAGPLPVTSPADGEAIQVGHIYVAPPDCHLLVERDRMRVTRGPKENRARPAIDPLFRSAARAYGPRVVGVILTGMLDDGVAGLLAVKQRGGMAVVQDPRDALFPDMPDNALRVVKDVDWVLPLREIAPLLTRLAAEEVAMEGDQPISEQLEIEDQFARAEIPPVEAMDKLGTPSVYTCPDCHGTLWEIHDKGALRFRCRVGHAYSAESFMNAHAANLEDALWIAMRTLEESASLNRRLAERARAAQHHLSAGRFMEKAVVNEEQAALIGRVLRTNKAISEQSATEETA